MEPLFIHFQAVPLPYFIECGKSAYSQGQQHPDRANLGMFDLLLVRRGTLYIGEDDRRWKLSAGEMLILLPDRYHYASAPCHEETMFYWLHFRIASPWREVAGQSELNLKDTTISKGWMHPEQHMISIPKHWAMPAPQQSYDQFDKLLGLFAGLRSNTFWEQQQIFAELLRTAVDGQHPGNLDPSRVVAERAEAYLKQHYHSDVTNAMLADALHFHPNYIARCMKEVYQCTPLEYLQHYRLEQAKLLLLKTDLPVSEISDSVGFHYSAYFTRCFTQSIGLTPRQYRKQFQPTATSAAAFTSHS
ncbi:helix-turn-helix transcriptional regulator [Paenibacillus sp. UNC451MF]|uniref:helix-turn-helix transcriptional regulator n=1 Tax=Paenibacillus sp. UNC451MF TaxID=1449063 RepID=UPI00068E830A|nr:AraC family transcriptional regulator [Paenibacillus sp. UNC451MF]